MFVNVFLLANIFLLPSVFLFDKFSLLSNFLFLANVLLSNKRVVLIWVNCASWARGGVGWLGWLGFLLANVFLLAIYFRWQA